jgi:deazaflavin-dependent oxidoreductase (nitroreductase family)
MSAPGRDGVNSESVPQLTAAQKRRRARHRIFWKIVNPPARAAAGLAPWWVLLETRGRRSGKRRRIPLARGPRDADVVWLGSVHGRRASWVRNIEASPEVRIMLSGRWHDGRATVRDFDEGIVRRFNAYARSGPRMLGIEPALVRVELQR